MAEDAAAQCIHLKVKDQQGSEVQFKIKKATPLRTLMDAYCRRLGLQASQVRFMVDGDRLRPGDTAESLELEDEDVIDADMEPIALVLPLVLPWSHGTDYQQIVLAIGPFRCHVPQWQWANFRNHL